MKVRGESRPSVDARCPESESLELDEHVTLLPVSLNLPPPGTEIIIRHSASRSHSCSPSASISMKVSPAGHPARRATVDLHERVGQLVLEAHPHMLS